jgi:hypothetical protein
MIGQRSDRYEPAEAAAIEAAAAPIRIISK